MKLVSFGWNETSVRNQIQELRQWSYHRETKKYDRQISRGGNIIDEIMSEFMKTIIPDGVIYFV